MNTRRKLWSDQPDTPWNLEYLDRKALPQQKTEGWGAIPHNPNLWLIGQPFVHAYIFHCQRAGIELLKGTV